MATTNSSSPLILSLDVGTLSVRAMIYNQTGKAVCSASHPLYLNRINDVEVEQDPTEIKSALFEVMAEVLSHQSVRENGVKWAGLSTQRSSVVAWHRESGKAVSPVLGWQDRRAADYLKPLASQSASIKLQSGLFLSPHYGATKLRWLLENNADVAHARESDHLLFGPLAAFILFHLVEGKRAIVDHVNASRTQLMDLQKRTWSDSLLECFQLDKVLLPVCQPTQSEFGIIHGSKIPVTAVNGDQNASIHGLGALEKGTFIVNIGTGAFVLLPTGNRPFNHPRLLTSIANSNHEHATYLLEGTVNGAGAALKWAEESWQMPNLSLFLDKWLAETVEPPIFFNTIGGLGSPLWESGPSPHFSHDATVAEKTVAIIESIIFLIKINLDAMTNTGQDVKRIRISGGLSEVNGLCQLLADVSQRLVIRSEVRQSTSRGIAWLAARPSESWNNLEDSYFLPRSNRPLMARYRTFCHELGWA